MKQTKQFLRPLLMAIVMLVGMLVPQGAWAEDLWVDYGDTITISSNESYECIEVQPGGVLIINKGVTLTVTSSLYIHDNSNGFGTVINYGTIIGDGHLGMQGGVLANHGHIELGGSSGIGTFTFYNTGTLGGPINLSHIGCDHDEYDNLGTVEATCTHGAGTQYRCKTCYYMRLDETSGALPHDFHNHNGIANICSSCGHTTYDEPAYGDGSEEDPYQIANAANLYWFADYTRNVYNHANAILTADIVLNDGTFAADGTFTATGADEPSKPFPWIRIGGEDDSYYGTFDGNGHTISGMYVNDSFGLFYDLYGSVVNLGIVNCYIRDDSGTGAICYWNDGTISNCYTTGILSGSYGYGICAENTGIGTISNCYSTCSFVFDGGGICGTNGGTISNCYTSDDTAIQDNDETASEVYGGVSADRFASGEIAYKLNGSVDGEGNWTAGATDGTQKWYQKLGEDGDSYPVLAAAEGNTVYYGYENCLSESETYSNDLRFAEKEDAHVWEDGKCTVCKTECQHKDLDEDDNCDICGIHAQTFASLAALIAAGQDYDAVNVAIDEEILMALPHPDPDLSGMYLVALKSDVQLVAPIPEPALDWQRGGRITGTVKYADWGKIDNLLTSKDADFWSSLEYTAPAPVEPIVFKSIDELLDADLENVTPVTVTVNGTIAETFYASEMQLYQIVLDNGFTLRALPVAADPEWEAGGTISGTLENVIFIKNGEAEEEVGIVSMDRNIFAELNYIVPAVTIGETEIAITLNSQGKYETTEDIVLTDGASFTANVEFIAPSITYTRPLASGKWGTLCLPYALSAKDGYEYFTLSNVSSDAVTLSKIEGTVAAGTPVLVRHSDSDNLSLTESNVQVGISTNPAGAIEGLQLQGTFVPKDVTAGYYLDANDNMLHSIETYCLEKPATSLTIPAFRAWFASSSPSGAPLRINIDDDEATAIAAISALTEGKAEIYDMNGRRIQSLQKGVNIMKYGNGKSIKVNIK